MTKSSKVIDYMFSKKGLARAKKYYAKKGGNRRQVARVPMPKRITGNFAARQEQFSLGVTAGIVYDFTHNINDLIECKQIANLYQYYRITSIELRFKPYFDTYIANSTTGSLPYLNFQYDKAGALQGTMDANNFEALGTKSYRLDDKTLIRRWKPSVITEALGAANTQFKVSPWLPTHLVGGGLNAPIHYGATFFISKTGPSDATVYDVDVVVQYQFRKPWVAPTPGGTGGNPPRMNQTMDGVVPKTLEV